MSHDFFFIVVVFVYHCINCSVHYAVFFSIKCWQEHHFNSLWKVWSTQFFVLISFFLFHMLLILIRVSSGNEWQIFWTRNQIDYYLSMLFFLQVFINRMDYINGCSLFKRNTISMLEYSEQYLVMIYILDLSQLKNGACIHVHFWSYR